MKRFFTFLCLVLLSMSTQAQESAQQPPVADKLPTQLIMHGQTRIDEYYWLRERENQKVIDYLNAENAYTESVVKPLDPFVEQLTEETKARIKQTDVSVPYDNRGYTYYTRTEDGSQYTIYCRKKAGDDSAPEEVYMDVNEIAKGHDFCSVRGLNVSDNNQILAYAVDTVGRRKYTLRFKDLATNELFADEIKDITGNVVWAADNKTVFYTRQDPQTLRSNQIFRHQIGAEPESDQLVFEEKDEEFSCGVGRTRSRKFIMISSFQTLSSEYRFLPADQPTAEAVVFQVREEDHEYSVDHLGDKFYVHTNWDAKNFRLMRTSEMKTSKDNWETLVAHDPDSYLADFDLFEDWLVLTKRENGQTKVKVKNWSEGSEEFELDFGEPCYQARTSPTPEPGTDLLRYRFSSLKTPGSVIEYDMSSRSKTVLKQDEVLGGFDADNYLTERIWATATDGTQVPVSLVHHKDTKLDGSAPCLLYAYGSYGSSMSASFSSSRFNLIDRGFVYAIAHVRGGQEMGRSWYEDGKLLNKVNTFTDFIDAGRHLVANGYASKDHLYARGGSAGGLLMAAVSNMAPELFDGIVADVPFVDVVTTMLDETIPLTTGEYDEWGNPNDLKYYNYMLSYSPYDQVESKDYPNILVTTGLHDSQVQYWEPAKWVARLRDRKTDNNQLLLKTNMTSGHGGASGRYDRYKEIAFRHAWLLNLAGIDE
jgi:oligopeptidase B